MNTNNNERTAKTVAGLFGQYILKPLAGWRARQRATDELMSLDEQSLKDIGVARCEILGIFANTVVLRQVANENPAPPSRAMGQD